MQRCADELNEYNYRVIAVAPTDTGWLAQLISAAMLICTVGILGFAPPVVVVAELRSQPVDESG